jgi:hypothetical protein
MKLLMQFSPTSYHFISLQSKYPSQHPVLGYFQIILQEYCSCFPLDFVVYIYILMKGIFETIVIHLFANGLFNDAVSNSDYTVPK